MLDQSDCDASLAELEDSDVSGSDSDSEVPPTEQEVVIYI